MADTKRTVTYDRLSADSISRDFGENVRNRREDLGFTQGTLADAIGISRITMNAIEQGRQWVRGKTLASLCLQLNCKPAELMTPQFF